LSFELDNLDDFLDIFFNITCSQEEKCF